MDKILVLHHSSFELPENSFYNESLAAYTHMRNLKSEIPDADFCSFIYLRKTTRIVKISNLAPWYYFKLLSIIFRIHFLLKLLKSYDKIIIYHSEGFYFYLPILVFFRKKIILQVNEIYSVVDNVKIKILLEKKIISLFKKLIVSNTHLKEDWFFNKDVLVRGGYFCIRNDDVTCEKNISSFIYVGSIDEQKMGNFSILLHLIRSIPENVELVLCLITNDYFFEQIRKEIQGKPNINLNRNIPEKDLASFYSNCTFGLVLQDANKPFNLTSFPSKVFSYLNNNLIPVAEYSLSFGKSEICDLFSFVKNWEWSELSQVSYKKNRLATKDFSINLTNTLRDFLFKN